MKIIIPRFLTMHFHNQYDGGAKLFQYLSEYLVKKGIEVTIVTTPFKKGDYASRMYNGVKYDFIPPYHLGPRLTKLNVPYKLIFSYYLLKYLKKEKFDLIHNSEAFSLFYLFKKDRKPVITQAHGLEPFYGRESLRQRGLKKIYVKLFLQFPWRFCLKNSEIVGSEEEFQEKDLERIGVKKENIIPIPNGIYTEGIDRLRKTYKNKRKELGIKKNDIVILNVNQIAPDKGVNDVIEAFSIIKKEIKNTKLIIIGKGVLEKAMHNQIKKLGLSKEVFHLKNIPEGELYNYHFSSDIFISATIGEDFMMSIQEAMACGLPVVSSNQPFLVKNGFNGYVVGSNNPKGLAEGIIKMYKNGEIKKMGKESIKMAKKYDFDNIANISINIYNKLIAKYKQRESL